MNPLYIDAISELKRLDIYGCITGSSMLYDRCDFDQWDSKPDIDVFAYTPAAWVDAVAQVRYRMNYHPMSDGEQWKINRTKQRGYKDKQGLTTVKLTKNNMIINISCKPHQESVTDVIGAFDQTCIMKGYDIHTGLTVDMTSMFTGDKFVSMLNPLRNQDCDAYTVSMWLRQWDRVLKYWQRGFDTRQCALQYIDMIDGVLKTGNLFATEKSKAFYEEATKDFVEMRDKMRAWYEEVKD